jgi:hypothetical protein
MQQSERKEATSSGTYKVPEALAYPKVLDLRNIPEIEGQFVYVIKGYPEDGLAITIARDIANGEVYLSINDFDGNPIDLTDDKHPYQWAALDFAQQDSPKFVSIMRSANIQKVILYVAVDGNDLKLVDLRASLNKFYGPGMIRDLFGKIYPTQEVIKTIALDEQVLDAIKRGEGSYQGDLVLKCSKFKTIVRGKEMLPLYARVSRSLK